jgi:hypothetical protein
MFGRLFKQKNRSREPVDHLYLLVHPYYDYFVQDRSQIVRFREIWMDSVSDAASRPGTFAIMYFPGTPSEGDEPDRFKFVHERPSKLELELGRHVQQSFGKENSKLVMISNIYPYLTWTYDTRIQDRMTDPGQVIVSARGVFSDRCVDDARRAARDAYHIPDANARVLGQESIYGNKDNARNDGFPDNLFLHKVG